MRCLTALPLAVSSGGLHVARWRAMLARHLSVSLVLLAACVAPEQEDSEHDDISADGKADGSLSDADQKLALRAANTLSEQTLDEDVGLSARAAANIVAERALHPFATLAELDAVPYIGPYAIDAMIEYAHAQGWSAATFTSIEPPMRDDNDKLGLSIALSGSTLAVASLLRVELYDRDASGTWAHSATLRGPGATLRFGEALALDGNTLAVYSRYDGSVPTPYNHRSSVRIYVRNAGTWTEQAWLWEDEYEGYGVSLSLQGDTLAVGSPGKGGAYIYKRSSSTWTETAHIAPEPSGDPTYNAFGTIVKLDGHRLAVSQPTAKNNGAYAVHVYDESGASWTRTATLAGTDTLYAAWGEAIALQGDTLLVSSPNYSPTGGYYNGKVTVYQHTTTGWEVAQELAASLPVSAEHFGQSLALDGDDLAIGGYDVYGALGSTNHVYADGAVYRFHRTGGVFTQQSRHVSPNGQWESKFGTSLELDAGTVVVAAPHETRDGLVDAGAVYVE